MTRRKRGRFRRRTYVAGLVGVSLAVILLPEAWTGKLYGLVQVIVPFQHAATTATDSVRGLLPSGSGTVSADDYDDLQRERDALQHQVATLSVQAVALIQEVEWLTASRTWDVGGAGIGRAGRLIPASVITEDLLPWRSSRLVNVGSLQGVQRGDIVASRHFTINRGEEAGLRDGLAILFR
ncbi:MAG: hypothetical protein GY851_12025, partial [bacterium]|nr:hypothetical protein [bacterium]